MLARHRGDDRIHTGWRPGGSATTRTSRTTQAERIGGRRDGLDRREARRRRSWGLLATLVVIAVAVTLSQLHLRRTAGAGLPSPPQQWVEQWTAASMDNPSRVCRQLFAPALAAVIKADSGRSCVTYYSDVNAKSFRIRHVLVDGNAAAVEVRELGTRPNWGYVTMLLKPPGAGVAGSRHRPRRPGAPPMRQALPKPQQAERPGTTTTPAISTADGG